MRNFWLIRRVVLFQDGYTIIVCIYRVNAKELVSCAELMSNQAAGLLAVKLFEVDAKLLHDNLDSIALHMIIHERQREFTKSEIRVYSIKVELRRLSIILDVAIEKVWVWLILSDQFDVCLSFLWAVLCWVSWVELLLNLLHQLVFVFHGILELIIAIEFGCSSSFSLGQLCGCYFIWVVDSVLELIIAFCVLNMDV